MLKHAFCYQQRFTSPHGRLWSSSWAPFRPSGKPSCAQIRTKRPPEPPKRGPRGFQERPRGDPGAAQGAQEALGGPREAPRRPPGANLDPTTRPSWVQIRSFLCSTCININSGFQEARQEHTGQEVTRQAETVQEDTRQDEATKTKGDRTRGDQPRGSQQ